MRNIATILCSAFLLATAVLSADDLTPPLAPASGSWAAACDAWGTPARCHASWRRGLHEHHWVQEYKIVRNHDEATLFSGRGLYRLNSGQIDGYWEDSQGSVHPLAGTVENGQLTVTWGTPDTEQGRSRYDFRDGTLQVQDEVLDDDGWRVFMTVDYGEAE